jgi:hypothetical protein
VPVDLEHQQLLGRRHDPVEHPPGIGEAEQRIPGAREHQHRAADAAVLHAREVGGAQLGQESQRIGAQPSGSVRNRRRVSGWPQTRSRSRYGQIGTGSS